MVVRGGEKEIRASGRNSWSYRGSGRRRRLIVIWKTNQYLISWRVIRFNFTASVPLLNISREKSSGGALFFPAGDFFFFFFCLLSGQQRDIWAGWLRFDVSLRRSVCLSVGRLLIVGDAAGDRFSAASLDFLSFLPHPLEYPSCGDDSGCDNKISPYDDASIQLRYLQNVYWFNELWTLGCAKKKKCHQRLLVIALCYLYCFLCRLFFSAGSQPPKSSQEQQQKKTTLHRLTFQFACWGLCDFIIFTNKENKDPFPESWLWDIFLKKTNISPFTFLLNLLSSSYIDSFPESNIKAEWSKDACPLTVEIESTFWACLILPFTR